MSCFLAVTPVASKYGRRQCILWGDILVMIGGIIQCSSYSIAQIVIARVIVGFGVGLISSTVPTYMSETTIKATERGREVGIQAIYLINGVAFAYWVDLGSTQTDSQFAWRFPIALQSLFTLLSAIGMLCLTDTPRWYYSQGRIDEGDQVLARLWARSIDDADVRQQKQEILDTLALEHEEGGIHWLDWFWDRSELQSARRIRTSFLILSLQQFMGINILVYFSTIILSQVGLDPFLQSVFAAVTNTIFAMGTWPTPILIERLGRRFLMLWTCAGCAVAMAIFIAMNGIEESQKTQSTKWTAIAFVIIFQFLMGLGWMACPWLYGPEIAPLRYRHVGGAAGAVGQWSCTFVTVFGGGIAVQRVGYTIWLWPLLSCVVTCVFVYFWCPETAGKTLEEIDHVFMEEAKRWPGYKRWHKGPSHRLEIGDVADERDAKEAEMSAHNEKLD